MTVLSFSILALILFSCSTCSCISAVASACFFLRPTMVASCWILASSRSLLSLDTSASLFLFSSIWALVAPLASLRRSPRFSSSLARSDLCLSALALPCLSASSSSSISSILAWTSLIVFWTLATRDCSSSSLLIRELLSFSLRWMAPSSSFLVLSSSETVSCMILSSPSIFLLAHQGAAVLLLALDGALQLLPGPLQLGDGLLHDSQLALDLPPLLLDVGAAALLLLVGALQLVQGGLQLALDLVEVTDLVLGNLQVLGGLGGVLADVLLLLVQLVDHLVLVGDLVVQRLDGVVSVGLLLLQLLDGDVDIVNVLLDGDNLQLQNLLVLGGLLSVSLSLGQFVLGVSQLLLQITNGGSGSGLLLVVDGQVALLLLQGGHQVLLLLLDKLVLLEQPLLGLDLVVVLAVHLIGPLLQQSQLLLGVRSSNHGASPLDDDEPSPLPHGHVLPEVPLGDLDQLPLVPLLGVHITSDPLEDLSLDHPHPFDDELVTSLLQSSQSSSPEEDEGVAEPVPLPVESNLVHQSVGGDLVVAGAHDLLLTQAGVSHLEVGVKHSVRETSHTDPDTLQHTVTGQLVHDQVGLNISGLLVGVGHKATDEVGLARVKGGHQLSQGDQVDGGHSLAAASLLLLLALILGGGGGLAGVVSPQVDQQGAGRGGLEDLHYAVVDGVLVLLQPVGHVVGHDTSVVRHTEVSILVGLGGGLQEDGKFAQGSLQLLLEGLVSGLGEERLLLEDGPETHGLLEHDDGSLQVHAEVHHDPVNALLDVLLLLHHEHVVVEELLQLLVDEVDGDLLEAVVLEDLETSDIEDSAEVGLLQAGVNECVVTLLNQPLEDTVEDGSGDTTSSSSGLLHSLALGHPLGSDLDPGLAESLEQRSGLNTAQSGHLAREGGGVNLLQLSLVVTTLLDVDDTSGSHHTGGQHVAVELLLLRESKNVEGVLGVLQLLIVVDGGDGGLPLGYVDVVIDVVGNAALGPQTALADSVTVRLEQLVEDVVRSLHLLLLSDTGLLQQVGHDVATSQLSGGREMDTDELSETGRVVVPGGLGVTVGLQDGVGGHNLVLKGDLLLGLLARAGGDHGKI